MHLLRVRAAAGFPRNEPARDALEAWPPESTCLGVVLQRREMFLAERDQRGEWICGQGLRILLSEVADRAVDHGAAVARAGRRVDRIERAQPENVLYVDGVGIAQPMLDFGHAQLLGARVECRSRPRPRHRLNSFRTVEVARPAQVL